MIPTQTTFTASDARDNLYDLIRAAGRGLRTYEITLRGAKPVVLMSKEEMEGWLETLDIMANPEEVRAINIARKQKRNIPLEKILKDLHLSI